MIDLEFLIMVRYKKDSFYYGGDCSKINERVLDMFENDRVNRIYIDTCKSPNGVHLDLENLKDIIRVEDRCRVYCMHLDNASDENDIKSSGFKVAGQN